MIVFWFLVVFGYHEGRVSIPQVSRERCINQVEWVRRHTPDSAYCVEGLK